MGKKSKSSGGGSTSGRVSYPAYMETKHSTWLDGVAADMLVAQGNSPYLGTVAYDPSDVVEETNDAVLDLGTAIENFNPATYWENVFDAVAAKIDGELDGAYLEDEVDAYRGIVDDQFNLQTLPEYKAAMRTLGAVNTSAYVVGEAILRAMKDRDINKYHKELRLKTNIVRTDLVKETMSGVLTFSLNWAASKQNYSALLTESNRIKIIAMKEQIEANNEYDVKDALWDLEMYQYGSNVLAAISGGVASAGGSEPSKSSSAIGGALSGAATGAMIGSAIPGVGTAVGAVVGGIAGLFS